MPSTKTMATTELLSFQRMCNGVPLFSSIMPSGITVIQFRYASLASIVLHESRISCHRFFLVSMSFLQLSKDYWLDGVSLAIATVLGGLPGSQRSVRSTLQAIAQTDQSLGSSSNHGRGSNCSSNVGPLIPLKYHMILRMLRYAQSATRPVSQVSLLSIAKSLFTT